jgi:hypothetical protein
MVPKHSSFYISTPPGLNKDGGMPLLPVSPPPRRHDIFTVIRSTNSSTELELTALSLHSGGGVGGGGSIFWRAAGVSEKFLHFGAGGGEGGLLFIIPAARRAWRPRTSIAVQLQE